MSAHGILLTLRLLRGSHNPAATDVLRAALNASEVEVRLGAVRAMAGRSEPAAQSELLAALGDASADVRSEACESEIAKRMRKAVLAALKSDDVPLIQRACRYAIDAELFVVLPTLIEHARQPDHPYGVGLATAALQLCRAMAHRIETDTSPDGVDPAFYRTKTLQQLSNAAEEFGDHQRLELIEALLLVTTRDNSQLLRLLRTEGHPSHDALTSTLAVSPSFGALDVLCHALIDSDSPKRLLTLAAERFDKPFLARLAEHVGYPIGARTRENAKLVPQFAWAAAERQEATGELTGPQQAALVSLAAASGANGAERLRFVGFVLEHGEEQGRVAACHLLRDFESPDVAAMLRKALEDASPGVIAAAARQLRPRHIAGAEVVLIDLLEHSAPEVRRAAQDELHELNLTAYRELFDRLGEPARRAAGRLVARADPDAAVQLANELQRPAVRQRMESLAMIDAMGLVDELSSPLANALSDNDAAVRAEAARLLGTSSARSEEAYTALADAVTDANPTVRATVEKSLEAMRSLDVATGLVQQLQDEFDDNEGANE